MGWTRIGPPVSGLPHRFALFRCALRERGYHAGKIFADRDVVSLAVRRGPVPRMGAGGQAGTATADTERGKHNGSPVGGIFATAVTAAAAGPCATHGRTAGWRKVRHQGRSGIRSQVRRGVRSQHRLNSFQALTRPRFPGQGAGACSDKRLIQSAIVVPPRLRVWPRALR